MRLTISILFQNDATVNRQEQINSINSLEVRIEDLSRVTENLARLFGEKEEAKSKIEDQYQNVFYPKNPFGIEHNKLRNVWIAVFGEDGKKPDEKKKKEIEEKLMRDPQYKDQIITMDPLVELHKNCNIHHHDHLFIDYT